MQLHLECHIASVLSNTNLLTINKPWILLFAQRFINIYYKPIFFKERATVWAILIPGDFSRLLKTQQVDCLRQLAWL